MANIKSAKKRILINRKKAAANKAQRSKMRTYVRQFQEAVALGNEEEAKEKFLHAEKIIRKTASKGVIHKNNADRKVSRLARQLNHLGQ